MEGNRGTIPGTERGDAPGALFHEVEGQGPHGRQATRTAMQAVNERGRLDICSREVKRLVVLIGFRIEFIMRLGIDYDGVNEI
jgi:hypothetical protein